MSEGKQIQKWMNLVNVMNEEAKSLKDKNSEEINKTDGKILSMKLDQLNRKVKQRYLDKDEETPDEKIYQFAFTDKGSYYEFTMPLNVLFGPKTQKYCADYWDDFFESSDIKVDFLDNIKSALKQAGSILLRMKLNKSLTKEVETKEE